MAKDDFDENPLIDLGGEPEPRQTGETIPCCVGSPPINFVTRPLQVRIKN